MTNDDKALVKLLRVGDQYEVGDARHKAADRIEDLSAENERLREALSWFLNDSRFVVQVGGNPNVVPHMIEAARAVLGETK